jgi:Arc/MetJ family transcription regulator
VCCRCTSRTNIEIDDELVAEITRRYDLETRKEAVDLALRKAAPRITIEAIEALRGIGWEGDPEEMRSGSNPAHRWR